VSVIRWASVVLLKLISKLKTAYHKSVFRWNDRLWRRRSPASTVIASHPGLRQAAQQKKLCLFSTFDPKGRIDPYAKKYIREIAAHGFDVVVVSTSPSLIEHDVKDISGICRAIIHRKNVVLDFGIRSEPVSSSIYMWDLLIRYFGFPFLKTEVVKINRLNFHNVVHWRSYIPESTSHWQTLIENHLKRAVPNARG